MAAKKDAAKKAAEPGKTEERAPASNDAAQASKRGRIAAAGKPIRQYRRQVAAPACEAAGARIKPPGWYVIQEGDTLWSIAQRHYGAGRRYRSVYAANRRRLDGPNYIEPCQKVYLPRAPRRA